MDDISDLPIGAILFIIVMIISLFSKGSKTKRATNANPVKDNLPAWYKTGRVIAQVVLVLSIIASVLMGETILLWIGIGGLVFLEIVHAVVRLSMMFNKRQDSSNDAVNQQPVIHSQASKDLMEQMYSPDFNLPKQPENRSSEQYKSIDHFGSDNTVKLVILVGVLVIVGIGVAVYLLFSEGYLEKFF